MRMLSITCLALLSISTASFAQGSADTGETADVMMPPHLTQVGRISGALQVMKEIEKLQREFRSETMPSSDIAVIARRQKLLYLRQKLIQRLESMNLEVNATRGHIEAEMAQVHEMQASMVEKRARALRRTSMINFVSGGITKIVGYAIAIGGIDQPTNVLEVVDGSIQCSLSGLTMRDLHSESHLVKEMPALLAVLNQSDDSARVYPPQIWTYLNEPSIPGGKSRRETMVSLWEDRGIFVRRDKAAKLVTGNVKDHISLARITPQLLDDRLAMLSELRSVVSQMHNSLMGLSQLCTDSYKNDPSFDWPIASSNTVPEINY
ncbi:MAG: hypothetical protein K2Z81_07925 [Cyanobacteria bacterium]|nr:hypothetical protein [Cyanobacteriota bacterium]